MIDNLSQVKKPCSGLVLFDVLQSSTCYPVVDFLVKIALNLLTDFGHMQFCRQILAIFAVHEASHQVDRVVSSSIVCSLCQANDQSSLIKRA